MQRHGLPSLFTNLFLLFFLFSSPMLASGMTGEIYPDAFKAAGIMINGSPGGNLISALIETFGGFGEGAGLNGTDNPREEYLPVSVEIEYDYYPVYGASIDEINWRIYDVENGAGPYDQKEGRRYAAYVTSDYSVDYQTLILGYGIEDGAMAIELGTEASIRQKIHVRLPDLRAKSKWLAGILEEEERRLLEHEMQHVAVYRQTGEKLHSVVDGMRVTGYGATFWEAYQNAREMVARQLDSKLAEAVGAANQMNQIIDSMTQHGIATDKLLAKERELTSSLEEGSR